MFNQMADMPFEHDYKCFPCSFMPGWSSQGGGRVQLHSQHQFFGDVKYHQIYLNIKKFLKKVFEKSFLLVSSLKFVSSNFQANESIKKSLSHLFSTGNSVREDVNTGGKIIMPPSALDAVTRLNIPYPLLFQLYNPVSKRTTHCGKSGPHAG